MHERTAAPSTCTVQAPHWAMPQPYFVPVSPSCSRSTQSSGVASSTLTSTVRPFTLSVAIACASWTRTFTRLHGGAMWSPAIFEGRPIVAATCRWHSPTVRLLTSERGTPPRDALAANRVRLVEPSPRYRPHAEPPDARHRRDGSVPGRD